MDNLNFNFRVSPSLHPCLSAYPVYRIKVIGIGGAGSNAISAILHSPFSILNSINSINSINFISANTDIQALSHSSQLNKPITPDLSLGLHNSILQLGPTLTKGFGTGGNPELGRLSALESADSIKSILSSSFPPVSSINVLFILAGLGGGTGTGASPVVAQIAKKLGFFVVSIITTPFDFEGSLRTYQALDGIYALKRFSNALFTFPNQKLLSLSQSPSSNSINSINFKDAFALSNDLIARAVFGIFNIITKPGIINVDLADVSSLLSEPGDSCVSIAHANGSTKASIAASQLLNSPLLPDKQLKKASGILLNVTSSENFTLNELNIIFNSIHSIVDTNVNIIFGVALDNNLHDELILTLIATGIKDEKQKSIIKEKTLKTPAFKRRIGVHSLSSNDQLLPFYKN